jgi:hypothetical protein
MPIVITQGTESRTPTLGTREIGLQAAASCCEAWGIYGFSAARVTGAPPFAGILDAHPDFCLGRGGRIVHEVPPGEKGAATVWGNIIANIPPGNGGVQGWSYALAAEGPATVLSATIGGTFAEIAHDGGFDVTEVIAPFRSPTGTVLVVSAVVLHLKKGATLPQVGTESILRMEIETEQPMGRSERILGFRMTSGCCTGEPIPNLLTIAGDSHAICNEFAVDVDVVFRPQPAFRRGDANDQGTVDIADAIWILQDLHGDGPGTPCWDAGDANDDGRFDISDAIYLLNHLFLGARPPPPPFGECGLDPTPDALPCETRC